MVYDLCFDLWFGIPTIMHRRLFGIRTKRIHHSCSNRRDDFYSILNTFENFALHINNYQVDINQNIRQNISFQSNYSVNIFEISITDLALRIMIFEVLLTTKK